MKKVLMFICLALLNSSAILFAQPTSGLVGYFTFSNNTLNSGSATITASAVNAPFTISNSGAVNSAIQFTGTTTSYVTVTDNGNLDFTGDFSISFAVSLATLTNSAGMIDNNANLGGYGISFFSNTLSFLHKNGAVQSPAGLFTTNVWKAVCVTRQGTVLRIYINGSLVATGSAGTAASNYSYPPLFGLFYNPFDLENYIPLNGKLDEIRFYNRTLSDAEVASLTPFTLPLTLLEFNGRLVNNNGQFNWKTTDEQNTTSFDVERSTDGRNYTTVGNVAAFNLAGIHQYTFIDNNITALGVPVVYYRLKQKDTDGRFTYSRIVALTMDNSQTIVLLYPNPVSNEANLTITSNKVERINISVVDNAGRIVKQQQRNISAGSTSLSIDVSRLAKGMYYLELKGETMNERKQFVK